MTMVAVVTKPVIVILFSISVIFYVVISLFDQPSSITYLFLNSFLMASLSTTLIRLLKSAGTVFVLSTSLLSTSVFKPTKSVFDASVDVSIAFLLLYISF